MKSILTVLMLCCLQIGFAQLTYESNGNVTDLSGSRVSPTEVRSLLAQQTQLLKIYNAGRVKKTAGNILLVGGAGLMATDLMVGLNADVTYPSALTFIGAAAVIIAIPVKIGFAKKIRNSVEGYNKQLTQSESSFKIDDLSICTNQNGVGFRLTF